MMVVHDGSDGNEGLNSRKDQTQDDGCDGYFVIQ